MTTLLQAKQRILNKIDFDNPQNSSSIILWGSPGLGKTSLIISLVCEKMIEDLEKEFVEQTKELDKHSNEYQKAESELKKKLSVLKFNDVNNELLELIESHCLVLRLAERPIEQITGIIIPSISLESGYARFVMPENIIKVLNSKSCIILLDELDKSSNAMMAAATHLLENKIIGDLHLKNAIVIACCNHESDSQLSNNIPPELRNRCCNIEISLDLYSWMDWGLKHKVRKEIILFHKATNGEWLAKYDLEQSYSFPTPRSWVNCSRVIDRLEKRMKPNPDDPKQVEDFEYAVKLEMEDFVGKRASAEFEQYRSLYMKFNVKEILDGTKRIPTPDNCGNESNMISDQCVAAFAMADQVKAEMLGEKGDKDNNYKFKHNIPIVKNLIRFISDLIPEVRTIYLQQIYTTKIMNIILDSGLADDIMEELVDYIAI
jgi:GTPase SAR1 family protein